MDGLKGHFFFFDRRLKEQCFFHKIYIFHLGAGFSNSFLNGHHLEFMESQQIFFLGSQRRKGVDFASTLEESVIIGEEMLLCRSESWISCSHISLYQNEGVIFVVGVKEKKV